MNETQNKRLTSNSQTLRKQMTKEERHLWYDFFKAQPFTAHRQKVIGNYIVDFYIASAKIVVELDGSQHYEEKHHQEDGERDRYLQGLGLTVLRYSNRDIHRNFDGVCQEILSCVYKSDASSDD